MNIRQTYNGKYLLLFVLLIIGLFDVACASASHVNIIKVQDSINPGVQDFVQSAIDRSVEEDAELLIILLDTPGGLMTSMRGIVRSILNADIPVVVYVYPSGAQAASAGVFITVAADIAAMAPGTNIGAAHPVTASGGDVPKTMNEKVVNDMLAMARSIAQQRGRNQKWLEDSIKESVSITADEAYKNNVIDLVAGDVNELLSKLNGWVLQRKGQTVILNTHGIEQRTLEPSWLHRILGGISTPNIAYILLMIGLAGLYFELSQPGAILPGVIGGIALVLALYALQSLSVNYAGVLLILLAVIFFILEIAVASYGMLSFAGVLSLILGSLMLFRTRGYGGQLDLSVLIPTIITVSAFFIAVASLAFRAQMRKSQTGADALEGEIGVVSKDLSPEGKVFVAGELWNAEASEPIAAGEKVQVIAVDSLKLKVKRIDAN
jgi:membrane-bound serine protease (ClpP class)